MTTIPVADSVYRLGRAVRDVRKRQNLTQAELAHRAHVSRMFVIDLEAGHPRAELGKALAVLEALGISSVIDEGSDDMTVTASRRPASTRAEDRLAFSDAALALAGHEVSDPALRSITERAARGDLTADEAIAEARRRVQGDGN
ncbi:helix-turn-helix domain-containing protein [Piscicoccus intestinalis]|uniref:helix-turn-helix domain-containing protein n=1 Tax=Piscicoccus intestinalis TaxID=746033 RepID=UPI001C3F412A|nr:helix-turn-helix domain-containing protein [Piscicoccus intestinalis]